MSDHEKSVFPILDIRKCRVYTLENLISKRFKVFGKIIPFFINDEQNDCTIWFFNG